MHNASVLVVCVGVCARASALVVACARVQIAAVHSGELKKKKKNLKQLSVTQV